MLSSIKNIATVLLFMLIGGVACLSFLSYVATDTHARNAAWKAAHCDAQHVACQKGWVR